MDSLEYKTPQKLPTFDTPLVDIKSEISSFVMSDLKNIANKNGIYCFDEWDQNSSAQKSEN